MTSSTDSVPGANTSSTGVTRALWNGLVWLCILQVGSCAPRQSHDYVVDAAYNADCASLASYIKDCLDVFTTHYDAFRNLADDEITQTSLDDMCRSYGEGLQCLHYTFLSCPPRDVNLDYLEKSLPDPNMMLPLCFPVQDSPATTPSPATYEGPDFSQDVEGYADDDGRQWHRASGNVGGNTHDVQPITSNIFNSIKENKLKEDTRLETSDSKVKLDVVETVPPYTSDISKSAFETVETQSKTNEKPPRKQTENSIAVSQYAYRKDCGGIQNCAQTDLSASGASRIDTSLCIPAVAIILLKLVL